MCGIFAVFNYRHANTRNNALRQSSILRHRGPDYSGIVVHDNHALAHQRLAIVAPNSGSQPFHTPRLILTVNGEIYNHRELVSTENGASDCEAILDLYLSHTHDLNAMMNALDGMFAFVLYDKETTAYVAARDHLGIIPLYYGYDNDGATYFASELKALVDNCDDNIHVFPPGHYYTNGVFVPWYTPRWKQVPVNNPTTAADSSAIARLLSEAVDKCLMTDVPWGVLLSGGLDSSLVAALAARRSARPIHSFTIGLENSPDLVAAQSVASHLGTIHHAFTFTLQEGLDALRDVIYHLETFDVTSIRASTPMFLMSRRIKAHGIKMILTGEGADEIFGGYLYFHRAPSRRELHLETIDKLNGLHLYDCNRANKATAAWGVEARVPFLDKNFVNFCMEQIDPADKMPTATHIEKFILRDAFTGLLPPSILMRQKEQFSDGVGYGWIDGLKAHAEAVVSDEHLRTASFVFPLKTPRTKEGYLYRCYFEDAFPGCAHTVPFDSFSSACSTSRAAAWSDHFSNDPSGRAAAGVHNNNIS